MRTSFLLAGLAVLFSTSVALAIPAPDAVKTESADDYLRSFSTSEKLLQEIDQILTLARDGDYGRIKAGDMGRLDELRAMVAGLLADQPNPRALKADDRLAIFNAQEEITAIVRNDDKNRKVCKRVTGTGSRLAKAECLTVAEREARAKGVRESAWHQQQFREPPCSKRVGISC
jgi:hypothetical protein